MEPWTAVFQKIETKVVAGLHQECRDLLNAISPHSIPREWATRFAEAANRIHYSLYALRALHGFVFPESLLEKPKDSEKMIYAYALLNLGAAEEAIEILNSVHPDREPEALFLSSLAHFRNWNYQDGLALLKEFVDRSQVSPYRRLVGKVNLIAAFIYLGHWQDAQDLLNQVIEECQLGQYQLLLGNCYELQGQVHVFTGQQELALQSLEKAQKLLQNQSGIYQLFVDKWIAISHCYQSVSPENLHRLSAIHDRAEKLSDWETVRECDLFQAIFTKNENLVRKVIMGTPSSHYRNRVRQLFGSSLRPLGAYILDLGAGGEDKFSFDPYEKQKGGEALHEKSLLLATYEALTSDFYKPSHMGALFKKIYPQEKFNPFTSPARVLQLLKRLDRWFAEQGTPLRIQFKKSEFKLRALSPCEIVIQRGKKLSPQDGYLVEVRNQFRGRTFSSLKVSTALGISQTSAKRLLRQWIQEGKIEAIGKGRGLTYQFARIKKDRLAA